MHVVLYQFTKVFVSVVRILSHAGMNMFIRNANRFK